MSLPNFTAEASIGNHESHLHTKGKYKKYDSSLKIEPAYSWCYGSGCVNHGEWEKCVEYNCTEYDHMHRPLYSYTAPGGGWVPRWWIDVGDVVLN